MSVPASMPLDALLLVVTGAILHATWNYFAKRAAGGAAFVWLYGVVSFAVFSLAAVPLLVAAPQSFGWAGWLAVAASAVIHIVYSLVLQRGYQVADFSVVYPLARGTGPLFASLGAVLLLAELPTPLQWVGIGLIVGGIFLVAGASGLRAKGDHKVRAGLRYGVLTGLCIAAYTLVDGWAIKRLGLSPLLYYYYGLLGRTLLLAPSALRNRGALREQWASNRSHIVWVGVLSPLAYCLVLYAMQRAPLSFVAPARELSMLLGTFFGAKLLAEKNLKERIAGALLMVAGVVTLVV